MQGACTCQRGAARECDNTACGTRTPSPRAGLRELDLQGCAGVDGRALAHLAQLPALGALVLDQCGLVGDAHLLALARLTSLTRLSLAGCRGVTGRPAAATRGPRAGAPRGLEPLARLPVLRELSLAGLERLGDDALAGLAAAPALAALHLDLCPLLTCAAEPPPRRSFVAAIHEGDITTNATPG